MDRPDWYRSAAVCQVAYDPDWPALFADEAALVAVATGADLTAIQHVGSTAVPGMSAKPIIDILVAVRTWADFSGMASRLAAIGYVYTPHSESDDPGRRVFRKPSDMSAPRTHHLHVTTSDSEYWQRLIAFRDVLRTVPSLAAVYAELKRDLAARFANDPDAYTRAKASFVRRVERTVDPWDPVA